MSTARFGNRESTSQYLCSLYAIDILREIRFGNLSPLLGMMFANSAQDVPWYNDKGLWAHYLEKFRPQIVAELQLRCLEALTELYEPFVDNKFLARQTVGLPEDLIQSFRNRTYPNNLSVEHERALEMLDLSVRHLIIYENDTSERTTTLSLREVLTYLGNPSVNGLRPADLSEKQINWHCQNLSILYRLFPTIGCDVGRLDVMYERIRRDLSEKSIRWAASVPCRTPEGVIGITELRDYETSSLELPGSPDNQIDQYLSLLYYQLND